MPPKRSANIIEFPTDGASLRADTGWELAADSAMEAWLDRLANASTEEVFDRLQEVLRDLAQVHEIEFLARNPDWQESRRVLEVAPVGARWVGSVEDCFPRKSFRPHKLPLMPTPRRRVVSSVDDLNSQELGGPVDAILLRGALQLMPRLDALLKSLCEDLVPGGSVFIIESIDEKKTLTPDIETMHGLAQKFQLFRDAMGRERYASLALAKRATGSVLETVVSKQVPVRAFDTSDKRLLVQHESLLAEHVSRTLHVAVDQRLLIQELLSWQFQPGAWGQVVMHHLQLKKKAL